VTTTTTDADTSQASGLELKPTEQEVLAAEIPPFAAALKDPAARDRYARLDEAVRAGVVPPDLVPSLEAMLELVLQTRRIRLRHGHEADQAASALFYRTPRGAALRRAAREVNTALEALRGQPLENINVMAGPGRHTLLITTDRCRLTLKIDAGGAQIENVEVGG
jgi:hypothetical protein